jgi:hypothetical protein
LLSLQRRYPFDLHRLMRYEGIQAITPRGSLLR